MVRKTRKLRNAMRGKDYRRILSRYGLSTRGTVAELRERSEKILGKKVCRCLKAVSKQTRKRESQIFGICVNAVLTKKNLSATSVICLEERRVRGLRRKTSKK